MGRRKTLVQGVKGEGGGDEANCRIKLMGEILLATCTCMVP